MDLRIHFPASANGYKIFAIIGHWITADFQPQHRFLDFQEIEGPDTGENLVSIIYKVLCELDIRAKLLSITGDNASNNLAIAEILYDLLKADYEQGNIQQAIRYQGEDSKLIQYDVTTRWNSSYCMLNDAWNLFDLLQEVQDRERNFKDFDIDIANAVKSAMTKYNKHYTLMDDSCDILYIITLLDPQFKKLVLEHELQDEAKDIITAMQEQLEIQYSITYKPELSIASEEPGPSAAFQNPYKTIVQR
ncbi:hypothetical protein TSTA_084790 [Talaromyces stipitatus ATCC 10500]|uniref:DUF659 domain-containing protein n=1 Tax=Talaromyces stipitatus (strain ATCC 10500 / CBS 375.48 / QM 6759 / NRRL 1006) TaxID=441959 RepID=B8M0F1_TALSN|nr:uncharacterized protein TSTA_084790 [Talaromyces stipitatus ATCC 10500]EED21248.1 hypothetical protein TSTA_084790 [Talaromyces stipitatus ATCC 10500]